MKLESFSDTILLIPSQTYTEYTVNNFRQNVNDLICHDLSSHLLNIESVWKVGIVSCASSNSTYASITHAILRFAYILYH